MFELEEYSSGYHDGFLNKYADSSGPTLDFYITDSLQDMLDIDIRSEVANVVGSHSEYENCLTDLHSSYEHAADALNSGGGGSSANGTKDIHLPSTWHSSAYGSGLGSSNSSSSWFGANNDFLADVGACVNPISVMPLISSSLIHMSPKANLNSNITRSSSPPPPSPNVNDTKSHLTFSPAHIKISANSIRNEQLTSHIPKQIVAISSAVTSATTAPATMATNSALQRKTAADSVKKDLAADLRKLTANDNIIFTKTQNITSSVVSTTSSTITTSATNTNNNNSPQVYNGANSTSSSTIKLGPGIGGLTFANNITYNKLKQQSVNNNKSTQGSPISNNGTIVLKRERESSPMQNITTINGNVTKIISRNSAGQTSSFTPKSIASSAHSNYMQQQQQQQQQQNANMNGNANNNANQSTLITTINGGIGAFSSLSSNGNASSGNGVSSGNISNLIAVKPLQQKTKPIPIESEFPKPAYSYSCLIAMALKNSRRGSLPVSEIYSFMCEHFPYFKTAPSGWKNSVRHNLSLNKCFEKIEKPPTNGNQRKGCLWAMNPERIAKMDEEVQKWSRKDPMAIRNAMVCPDNLEALERGEMKHGSTGDSDVEMDSQSEIEETSDLEQELDETIVDNILVEEDMDDEDLLTVNGGGMSNGHYHQRQHTPVHEHEDDSGGGSSDLGINNIKQRLIGKIQRKSSMLSGGGSMSAAANISHGNTLQRDFDIEVEDIYDAIDIDDDKEAVRAAISQSDIIELSPADYNLQNQHENHQSPKRARLNINYSIGPAGEIEKQIQSQQSATTLQQQLQIQNIKKIVKVQDFQQLQQQLQQQHILVQTITTNGGGTTLQQTTSSSSASSNTAHFTQIGTLSALSDHTNPTQHRRKMQLVNRIA